MKKAEFDLGRAFAVGQHHDGITGTDTQAVNDDYVRSLDSARTAFFKLANQTMNQWFDMPMVESVDHFCQNLNVSVCEVTESNRNFTVGLYNPSDEDYRGALYIPVNATGQFTVTDNSHGSSIHKSVSYFYFVFLNSSSILFIRGKSVPFDVIPTNDRIRVIRGQRGFATHQLLIRPEMMATDLTLVTVSQSDNKVDKPETTETAEGWNGSLENSQFLIALDPNLPGLFMVTPKDPEAGGPDWFRLYGLFYNSSGTTINTDQL